MNTEARAQRAGGSARGPALQDHGDLRPGTTAQRGHPLSRLQQRVVRCQDDPTSPRPSSPRPPMTETPAQKSPASAGIASPAPPVSGSKRGIPAELLR